MRKRSRRGSGKRMAPNGVRFLPGWIQVLPSDARGRQAVLGAELDRDEDSYTALDGGHEAMLCWGPNY